MSLEIAEQSIPVIGVPSASVQAAQSAPSTVNNVVKKVNNPPKQKQKKEKIKKPVPPNSLILSTGQPKQMNGTFVIENEAALTELERQSYNDYVEKNMLEPNVLKKTEKQKKKHRFRLRLLWLLNKNALMTPTNKSTRRKLRRQMNKGENGPAVENVPKPKQQQQQQPNEQKQQKKQPNQQKKPPIQQPKHMKRVEKYNAMPLMDIVVQPYAHNGNNEQMGHEFYDNQEVPSNYQNPGGYQYLNDNWINSDKPWRTFQTSSSSTSEFSTFPTSSSILSTGFAAPPATYPIESYSAFHQIPSSVFSSNPTHYSPVPIPSAFNNPPPSYPPTPSLPSTVSELISQAPTGYPSMYSQEFNIPPPSQQIKTDYDKNQYSVTPTQPTQTFPPTFENTAVTLQVSEEELARQKRLIEIEEELSMINARKMQMQMEAEIRQKELELVQRQQMVEMRERNMRDMEYFEIGRRSTEAVEWDQTGRHHHYYDDHGSSNTYSHHHHDARRHSSDSRHSSNPRQISIERNADAAATAARRHGQHNNDKKKLPRKEETKRGNGGEGSGALKRSADSDINRAGRIQPAKRQRHRHPPKGKRLEELQMQAISDDEH